MPRAAYIENLPAPAAMTTIHVVPTQTAPESHPRGRMVVAMGHTFEGSGSSEAGFADVV